MAVPDVSMAGREPPHMGPVAHGFAALGDAAERAVSQLTSLAADAVQAPSRLGQAAALLTADGRVGTLWQVTAPFGGLLLGAIAVALAVHHLLKPQRRVLAVGLIDGGGDLFHHLLLGDGANARRGFNSANRHYSLLSCSGTPTFSNSVATRGSRALRDLDGEIRCPFLESRCGSFWSVPHLALLST